MVLIRSTGGKKITLKLQPILELEEGEGRAPSFIRLAEDGFHSLLDGC